MLLNEMIKKSGKRCLFWLDGHYSGKGTGKDEMNCPTANELIIIKNSGRKNDVILIDDAREFKGKDGYPALYKVLELLYEINPNYKIEIKEDCIMAFPNGEL